MNEEPVQGYGFGSDPNLSIKEAGSFEEEEEQP